ncbi:MAG: protein kinase domain-containing protein [Planctomycetaceae bacterium]
MSDGAETLGRFTDVRRLGAGGMGMVFTAFDPERKTRVALKTIKNVDGEALYRFKREFRALTDLAHPNLCPLYELLSIGETWFITMPFIDGHDLMVHLRMSVHPPEPDQSSSNNAGDQAPDHAAPDEPLTGDYQPATGDYEPTATFAGLKNKESAEVRGEGEVVPRSPLRQRMCELCDEVRLRDVFAQITRGIAALHQSGRLHRDLKPGNVMVTRDGRVQVLDFGLVAETQDLEVFEPSAAAAQQSYDDGETRAFRTGSAKTDSGYIVGTVAYMAPEQAAASTKLYPPCDWYAVGIMLFEAMTGTRPFVGKSSDVLELKQNQEAPAPASLVEGIPEDLNQLCLGLLQRDPDARPTAHQILKCLTGVDEDPCSALLSDQHLPFVGREDLLRKLLEIDQQVRMGRPSVVRVHGRSGAGKSLLTQRFLDSQQLARDVVLTGRCYEQESVPYKALDGVMDSLTRALLRMTPNDRSRLLPSHAAELARVFAVLQRIPELAEAVSQLPPSEAGELRRRAMRGLRELLCRLGERYYLTIAIDDFQWGDTDSPSILLDLLRGEAPPRMLLLFTYRDEYETRSDCLRDWLANEGTLRDTIGVVDLPVGPLNGEEAAALASKLLPATLPQRDEMLASIVRESAGNPLFVIELALAAQQGRGWPLSTDGGQQHLLDEVLWNRISELPDDVRRLLEVIAVAGHPTRLDVIYDAAGFEVRDPQMLNRLRIDRLVRSSGPHLDSELEAYHDRIRESVVAHLPPPTRVRHHGGLADCLERSGSTDAETLAVHFLGAEVHEKAGRYFALAGDAASDALAFDHAVGLYRQALTHQKLNPTEAGTLRGRLGTALSNAGRGEQAAIEFAAAAELSAANERLDLQRQSAYQFCISGHVEKGRAAIRELLTSVGLTMPRSAAATVGSLLWHRGRLWWRGLSYQLRPESDVPPRLLQQVDLAWAGAAGMSMFDILSGSRLSSVTLLLALEAGEPHRLVRALCWEAVQRINAGGRDIPVGDRMIGMAREIAQTMHDPYSTTMVPFATGIGEFMKGRWAESIQTLDQAAATFSKSCRGVHWELGTARLFSLYGMFWSGRIAEHRRRSTELHAAAVSHGDFYAELSLGTYDLPFQRLVVDAPDEAARVLDNYAGRLQLGRYSLQDLFVMLQRNYLGLYCGQPEVAWQVISSSWKELQRSLLLMGEHIRMACWEARARAAIACVAEGIASDRSRREARRAIHKIEREHLPRFACLPPAFRAGLAAADGDKSQADRRLREAIELASQSSMVIYLHPARWQLGRLIGGREGAELTGSAEHWMQQEGIRHPARFSAMMIPGFANA